MSPRAMMSPLAGATDDGGSCFQRRLYVGGGRTEGSDWWKVTVQPFCLYFDTSLTESSDSPVRFFFSVLFSSAQSGVVNTLYQVLLCAYVISLSFIISFCLSPPPPSLRLYLCLSPSLHLSLSLALSVYISLASPPVCLLYLYLSPFYPLRFLSVTKHGNTRQHEMSEGA